MAYKAALLARLDEQIRLLRSVTYWYLLPLSLPSLWQAVHVWDKSPWAAVVSLAVVVVLFAFLRWLNITAGVGALRATRANVESMFSGGMTNDVSSNCRYLRVPLSPRKAHR